MDRIVALHGEDMDIVVQPGVQWKDLNQYLKPHGLFIPGFKLRSGSMRLYRWHGRHWLFGYECRALWHHARMGPESDGGNAPWDGSKDKTAAEASFCVEGGGGGSTSLCERKSSAGYDLTKLFIGLWHGHGSHT
ncbi:hypothetical protein BC936DRAFT_144637 [Jimgerdemannia flammicorona]|uniref:FAD linked oxidase N-terminal domain-containing protein n=1 Tax=Jimgerdemannia flammicorona TaxID=994334 RepID=A0A433DC34_9FUNG|nr:hypothetical protein BC936DRAFT_144637 [Jimgerdemannia flammicorona]